MDCQPNLAYLIAKLDSLTQEANTFCLDAKRLKENVNSVVTKLETRNQNPKSSTTCVIPTAREIEEKSDNNKSKNIEKDFFKLSPIIKCYKCQAYRHIVANCPSPFKITITDKVFIKALEPDNIISPKVTPVIKEFTATRSFPSTALLLTPHSPPLLLPTSIAILVLVTNSFLFYC